MNKWLSKETIPLDIPILVTDGKGIALTEIYVIHKPKGSYTGMYGVGFTGYEWRFDFDFEDITHWMAVPDLPK